MDGGGPQRASAGGEGTVGRARDALRWTAVRWAGGLVAGRGCRGRATDRGAGRDGSRGAEEAVGGPWGQPGGDGEGAGGTGEGAKKGAPGAIRRRPRRTGPVGPQPALMRLVSSVTWL